MENEQKICYQFCSAITNLALALIYHSTILKFWEGGGGTGFGGGESQGAPPLYETLCTHPNLCVSAVYLQIPLCHMLCSALCTCSHRNIDLKTLKHEAEFYGVLPLGMCVVCAAHVAVHV